MKQFIGRQRQLIDPEMDIVLKILTAANEAKPEAKFISSLLEQYRERGGLSKKQLEGLHSKASKIEGISVSHLATLQAIINKKQTRYKSEPSPLPKEEDSGEEDIKLIDDILGKYPQHKRLLFFKMKTDTRDLLTTVEKEELKRFHKLLMKS
ncbi:MAG: hypothetical protein EOO13_09985 [Chitinophagaceae bacterium]|nr:MAG: hypothetical protein EOO13_09985 [Chitinophagaceae bacterium]